MTFPEAAMIMMSGRNANIRPLSITANGPYEASKDVDGYNPVLVNVPDRYDEGYQDGSNDTRSEIGNNPNDPTHIIIVEKTRVEIETNPDDPTHKKLYDEGFAFADEFFNGGKEPEKLFKLVIEMHHLYEDPLRPQLIAYFKLYRVSDGLEISSEQRWTDGTFHHSYGARVTNIEWGRGYGKLYVTLTGSDVDGNIYNDRYKVELAVTYNLTASNTNIVSATVES